MMSNISDYYTIAPYRNLALCDNVILILKISKKQINEASIFNLTNYILLLK